MTAHKPAKPVVKLATGKVAQIFDFRAATNTDFEFCELLYMSSMKPLLKALDAWDEQKVTACFKDYFITGEIRIILVDSIEVGWIQVSETADAINLDQVHLLEEFRGRGIGSQLIEDTMANAAGKGRPVLLSLVRGNRAIRLYERLGFSPDGKDSTKDHMRWETDRAAKLI
jgi:GNAT superfamily N-acetyltransferase